MKRRIESVTTLLLLFVLVIDGVALWGILAARNGARRAAREELRLQTTAHARALEAALASLRGDFLFLSQSPPLAKALSVLASDDPMVSRWGRLDVDGSLLLFMEAHRAVERIVVRDPARGPLVVAGRRGGGPALLVPSEENARPAASVELWKSVWPLGGAGREPGAIEAWIDRATLLDETIPGFAGRLSLVETRSPADAGLQAHRGDRSIPSDALSTDDARAAVHEPRFVPPIEWTLARRASGNRIMLPVESLAARTLPTVLLNATLMLLTLLLGLLALREARRSARLEAEREQQAKMRELERQVQHSDRLASVGRFAAGIAHEINNPLEGMSNYLTVLEEELKAEKTADALLLVPLVREGLERAAGITRQVLRYADPGKAPKDAVELGDVLHAAAEFVRKSPAFRGVAVRLALPEAPLTVLGNRTTLDQLFLNLLVNACEAQGGAGSVALAASREGARVVVTVADEGPGIPDEARARLFEPFASSRGSTGLGLSVCHGIVAEHGGAIRGENGPHGGALFHVEIPLLGVRAEAARA